MTFMEKSVTGNEEKIAMLCVTLLIKISIKTFSKCLNFVMKC